MNVLYLSVRNKLQESLGTLNALIILFKDKLRDILMKRGYYAYIS